MPQKLFGQSPVIGFLWGALLIAAIASMALGRWPLGFVALGTLALATAPVFLASRFNITLPVPLLAAITLFIIGSVFLGEAFDFYEKLWWWDLVLHGTSAIGLGLIGFLFIFMLFEGDRYAAPPISVSFFAFCFAMTCGAIWEVFEYLMDLTFGLNMQKSGLDDTMSDLMIDAGGAFIGALSGFIYLKGRNLVLTTALINDFVKLNRRLYHKSRDRLRFRRRP